MRLIDSDDLLKTPNVRKVDEFDETGESISYLAVPVETINNAPTIEAEPIVRCKNCMFSRVYRSGQMYCCLHENYTFFTKPHDYCSHGAKMDLEEE